jgi:hypothetical protein
MTRIRPIQIERGNVLYKKTGNHLIINSIKESVKTSHLFGSLTSSTTKLR